MEDDMEKIRYLIEEGGIWGQIFTLYIIHWDLSAFYYITAAVLNGAGFLLMYNVKI
jgi:hypothetical protein